LTPAPTCEHHSPLLLIGGAIVKGKIYPTPHGYQVRFGRKLTKRFKDLGLAEQFLNGLRFKTYEGTFDIRDYQKDHPLGFATQAHKWLKMKTKQVKPKSYNNLNNYMTRAVKAWGQTNIKIIGFGHIEDFLYGQDVSDKTRSNMKSCLHSFFRWVHRRERIPMPDFPETPFELGWRNIIDIETQQRIISEVREISHSINPRIWLGIKWLATYISVRPGELISLREGQVNLELGAFIIPHPKEKAPKLVYLLQGDIECTKGLPRALPDVYFFRHGRGISGCRAGQKFGPRYLYKWWKKACDNLGVEGVDLYGGTRHSTATALGKICTPEEVQDATGHASKAFQRYFQNKQARALKVTEKIRTMTDTPLINISGVSEKDKVLKLNK